MMQAIYSSMQNGLEQLKIYRESLDAPPPRSNRKQCKLELLFDSFNPEKLIPKPTPKKEQVNIYEIRQLVKEERSLQSVRKNNYFQSAKVEPAVPQTPNLQNQLQEEAALANSRGNKQSRADRAQREKPFNTTPLQQLNYKSVTPGRQIVRHVELDSPKNQKLFSLQYKLKAGKHITINVHKSDNLIKLAHQITTQYSLDHNVYVHLLKSLKEKYNQCLESQWSNRRK